MDILVVVLNARDVANCLACAMAGGIIPAVVAVEVAPTLVVDAVTARPLAGMTVLPPPLPRLLTDTSRMGVCLAAKGLSLSRTDIPVLPTLATPPPPPPPPLIMLPVRRLAPQTDVVAIATFDTDIGADVDISAVVDIRVDVDVGAAAVDMECSLDVVGARTGRSGTTGAVNGLSRSSTDDADADAAAAAAVGAAVDMECSLDVVGAGTGRSGTTGAVNGLSRSSTDDADADAAAAAAVGAAVDMECSLDVVGAGTGRSGTTGAVNGLSRSSTDDDDADDAAAAADDLPMNPLSKTLLVLLILLLLLLLLLL